MSDTTDNKANRARIIVKVQALLSKTVDNGCSEAEALSAAGKADELMQAYDLTFTDIETEVRDETYGARKRPFAGGNGRRRAFHEVRGCVCSIAAYWDCRAWSHNSDLVYFGSKDDSEQAHVMTDMLRLAMDGEWGQYLKSPDRNQTKHGKTLRASFMIGMSVRLAEQLRDMKAARSAATGTGTALVVVKSQVVTEKYAQYLREWFDVPEDEDELADILDACV